MMTLSSRRVKAGVGLVLVAVAAIMLFAVVLGAGSRAAASQKKSAGHAKVATIKMAVRGGKMNFYGPKTVKAGAKLRIVNDTNPKQVGPHTFTLVTNKNMPTSPAQMKRCEKMEGVCADIAAAHQVNPKTFAVGKRNVDVGRKGWDKPFGKVGDSWYTEKKGQITGRKVSARPGTVLRFFCVIHPWMQGKIKVTPYAGRG